eukprot:2597716-Rhodomonas_salina.3
MSSTDIYAATRFCFRQWYRRYPPPPYLATPCPVLKSRMLLPGSWKDLPPAWVQVKSAIRLRARYPMPGTDVG